MSDVTAPYERAIATFSGVLSKVSKEDLDKQSPCASWKVRDVVKHLVEGSSFFISSVGGSPSGDAGDVTDGDYQAAFEASANRTVDAFNQPGALDRTVTLPFGEMPAEVLVGIATTDTFTHAWDVAKATGQSTDIDPEFAAGLLERAKSTIPDSVRGPDGTTLFGPQQQAPAGASTADQLAAFLGRVV